MKRGLVFGLLILCVAGVGYLFVYGTKEHAASRRGGLAGNDLRGTDSSGESYDGADASVDGSAGPGRRGRGRDDDPNRIPGPDVKIRGVVMRGDKPVPKAAAALYRSHPRHGTTSYQWEQRQTDRGATELARTECDKAGRFTFTIPRRSELIVFANAPAMAFAWRKLLIPPQGDPEEVVIQLGEGRGPSGRVVDDKNEPVAGVTISVTSYDWRSPSYRVDTTTNEQGLFRFDELRDGNFYVGCWPESHAAQRRYISIPAVTEILFQVSAGGSVAGRVTNSLGDPVAGAMLQMATGNLWTQRTGAAEAQTDENGEYRIPHVLAGPLRTIVLEHPDYGTRSTGQDEIMPPKDVVKPGQELRFDIALGAGVPVRGVVVEKSTDKPVPGAAVKLLRMNKQYSSLSVVAIVSADAEGRFRFPSVAEGTYGLEASSQFLMRHAYRSASGKQPMTIDFFVDGESAPEEQRLVMTTTGIVRGKVEGVSTKANPNMNLSITVGDVNRRAQVDAFGTFEFQNVPPTMETTIRAYNPTMTSDPFAVKAGEVVEQNLSATDQGGWAGVVQDGEGNAIAGVMVSPIVESQIKGQIQQILYGGRGVRTDSEGRFLIPIQDHARKQQSKMKWVLVAVHPEYEMAMTQGLDMPAEGKQTDVELELEQGGTIAGQVIVQDGGSAANIRVSVYPVRDKEQPYETRPYRYATTDLDGSFMVHGVGPGNYRVSAWAPNGRSDSSDARAGDTGVRVVITRTEAIAGMVVDEDGFLIKQGRIWAVLPTAKGERKHNGSISAGHFRISNMTAGSYEIVVAPESRRGRAGPAFEQKRVGPIATGTDNLVITVSWGNKLTGRVLGPGGKRIAGASVVAMKLETAGKSKGRRSRTARPMAVSNGRGEFTIKGLSREEVELLASAPGFQATTMRTAPGSSSVEITLKKGEVIEGRILKPDGKPLANQYFSVQPLSPTVKTLMRSWQQRAGNNYGSWSSSSSSRTDSEGRFSLTSLLPGQYKLSLRSEHGVAAETPLQSGTRNVVIQLEPALTISGVVVDTTGSPVQSTNRSRIYVSARQGSRWLTGVQVGDDGSFELKGMPSGNLTLQVWGGSGYKTTTMEVSSGDRGVRVVMEPRQRR